MAEIRRKCRFRLTASQVEDQDGGDDGGEV
jgi:hypothetical protein